MKELPQNARIYVLANLFGAALLLIPTFASFAINEIWLILALCLLASLTQVFKVEGSTERSSYNVSWILYGFSLVLLGAPQTLIVILVSHIVEWIWYKYAWVIQTFNIASYIIVTITSSLVLTSLRTVSPATQGFDIFAVLLSLATFTILNHISIGLVIKYARGQGLKESGVLGGFSLILDFTLLCLGAASAYIWTTNPLAIILNVIPLYLIYSTLKVPSLQRKTDIDQKTGLYNSRFFSNALEKELARSTRFDRPLTVVMADMDLLRNINNTYGHIAGDEVLIEIANTLKRSFREYDVVSRFGGEEFAILMPETTLDEAIPRVEEIRRKIEKHNFEISTNVDPIKVTMSFGIAEREGFEQSKDQILHNADKALYRAKLSGRNKLSVHSEVSKGNTNKQIPVQSNQPSSQQDPEEMIEIIHGTNGNSNRETEAQIPQLTNEESLSDYPEVNRGSVWKIRRFIGGFAALSVALFFLLLRGDFQADWYGLIIFAALAMFAEGLSIDINIQGSTVSTSAVPFIAGLLLYGPISAGVIGLSIAVVAWLKNRSPIHRLIFNVSNHVIGGLICSVVVLIVGDLIPPSYSVISQFAFGLIFGGLLFLSTTVILSWAISIEKSVSVRAVWDEHFRWLGPVYIAMGALGYALMLTFLTAEILGVVTIIAPLLMLRRSQYQYLKRTKELVKILKFTNTNLTERSREINLLNDELLEVLAEVIDLRDPYVLGHSQNVARNARRIGQELGLNPDQIDAIYKAGLLHDLGKIGIPGEILQKPGMLTSDEYETVKKHPVTGAELIGKCHSLKRLVPIIRHHHEKFDGRGYPDRLRGSEIPIEARVLAMADVVEAMSSDRPYRNALGLEKVIEEVKEMSGEWLDPQVVDVFLKLAEKEAYHFFQNSASSVCEKINGNENTSHPWISNSIDHPIPL
jgi:diguanylate cyclase (GGDEF)-like protein/putative nucleotidyltransferase with HDIG domain